MTNKPGDLWMLNGRVCTFPGWFNGKQQPAVKEYRAAVLDEYGLEISSDGWWLVPAADRAAQIAAAEGNGIDGDRPAALDDQPSPLPSQDPEASALLVQAMHALNTQDGSTDLPAQMPTAAVCHDALAPAIGGNEDPQATSLLKEAMRSAQAHTHEWLSMSAGYSRSAIEY